MRACKARTAYTVLSDPSGHRERECNVALAYIISLISFSANFLFPSSAQKRGGVELRFLNIGHKLF